MMNKKLFLLPLLVLMLASAGNAQEYITGFNHGGTYPESKVSRPDNEPLSLPFFDDFSGSGIYPDESRWQTNNVFVNSGFPYMPVNHGTATLDVVNRAQYASTASTVTHCLLPTRSISASITSPAASATAPIETTPSCLSSAMALTTLSSTPSLSTP